MEGLTGPEAGRVAAALRDIRGAMPEDITPEALMAEIRTRARRYREKWSGIDLTPTGLAANWSQFGVTQKKEGGAARVSQAIQEPSGDWRTLARKTVGLNWVDETTLWFMLERSDKVKIVNASREVAS